MEYEDIEDIPITQEEVNDFFDQLLKYRHPDGKLMSQKEISNVLGVHQVTISRNRGHRLAGKNVTSALFETIAKILRDQQLKELQAQRLQERLEAERAAEAQRQADREAQRERKRKQRQAELTRQREEELERKADEERRAEVFEKLKFYWAYMSERGMLEGVDDPATLGDAPELLEEAELGEIKYLTLDIAALSLAADDQLFPCGQTAAQLRSGITVWQRMNGGYPDRINDIEAVPLILRPDAAFYYGDDHADITSWQCMNTENRAIAVDSLPLFVSPDAAKAFQNFVTLDERLRDRGYVFVGSCLDECDVESRLRKINSRVKLHVKGARALKGLKRLWRIAVAILVAVWRIAKAIAVVVWRIADVVADCAKEVWCYIGPKDRGRRRYNGENMLAQAAFGVCLILLFLAVAVALLTYIRSQSVVTLQDVFNFLQAVIDATLNPWRTP